MVSVKRIALQTKAKNGGGKRDRTDDLFAASEALSQLSYTPTQGIEG